MQPRFIIDLCKQKTYQVNAGIQLSTKCMCGVIRYTVLCILTEYNMTKYLLSLFFLCDWLESKFKSAKVAVYPPRLALISCETLWCLWQTPVCVSSSVTLVTVAFSQEQMSLGAAHLNGIQMTRTKSVDLCWWCETTWGYPGWGHMWFFFFLKWSAINNNLMIFFGKATKRRMKWSPWATLVQAFFGHSCLYSH